MPAFPHVMPHALMCLRLSWEHPLSISACRQPSKSVASWWKKKLLTEKRDKEKVHQFVVMGEVTDYRGNTKEHCEIGFIPQRTISSQISFLLKEARAFNSPRASQTQNSS